MRTTTVRSVIAILIVGMFMVITGVMAIFPLTSKTNVEMDAYASFFAKTASVYTGIVGVIIGYYFGRTSERDTASKGPTEPQDTQGT